jgi:hypothetical protein
MHRALPTHAADYLGPVVGGLVLVLLMSLLKEPTRRNFNAIETSSFGCCICDAVFSAWFFAGAPSLSQVLRARGRPPDEVVSKNRLQ